MLQKLLNHQDPSVPRVRDINPAISEELSDLVFRMMAPSPADRPQTPHEVIAALSAEAHRLGLGAGNRTGDGLVWTTARRRPQAHWRRHLGWITAAAVLVTVAGLLKLTEPSAPAVDERLAVASGPGGEPAANAAASGGGLLDGPAPTPGGEGQPPGLGASSEDVATGGGKRPGESTTPPPSSIVRVEPAAGSSQELATASPGAATSSATTPTTGEGTARDRDASDRDASDRDDSSELTSGAAASSTSPVAVSPGGDEPDPAAVDDAERFVLVGADGGQRFETLQAAVRAADDGGTIEVLGSGPVPLRHRARIDGKLIRLRSRSLGARPQLTLAAEGPATADSGIIELSGGGTLEVFNLDLVVAPALDPQPVFSVVGSSVLILKGVVLTRESPLSQPAGEAAETRPPVVRLAGQSTYSLANAIVPAAVDIEACLIRGALQLVSWDGRTGGDLTVEQTGLALEGPLLHSPGSASMIEPGEDATLELRLTHLTAMLPGPLVHLEGDELRQPTPVHIDASDCVLAAFDRDRPLLRIDSETRYGGPPRLEWTGERNRFDWSATRARLIGPREVPESFAEWIKAARPGEGDEVVSRSTAGVRAWPDVPTWRFGQDEFALAIDSETRGTAKDASDAGLDATVFDDLLPMSARE